MTRLRLIALSVAVAGVHLVAIGQARGPVAIFGFDGGLESLTGRSAGRLVGGPAQFVAGLDGQALGLTAGAEPARLTLDSQRVSLARDRSFSVQFWIRTTAAADKRMVVLSQKPLADNSLASQKQAGWVFYVSGGTWAWNLGAGGRRITYERDNGQHMPVNDGRWHQLTMTHDSDRSEVRLFYDGVNKVVYNVDDATGFDFTSDQPVSLGWEHPDAAQFAVLPAIQAGAETLQALVDEFNALGVAPVEPDEFVHVITDPRGLFDRKGGTLPSVDFARITELERELMDNPYTIHQVVNFMDTAPLLKVFSLVDGRVTIRERGAATFAARERLDPPEFDLDNLAFWDRALSPDEVRRSYAEHFAPDVVELDEARASLTAAAWNIWHGGKHFTTDEHGWDSRVAIADMLRDEGVDVVMMQETYSAGDFIAAELGYSYATTVDWDYLNQGANISVLSRFPIAELHVQEDSPFMNVAVKLRISQTQDLYAMSNWYGMDQFPAVFEFHESRFGESDTIPTLFGGDFNAVPHTDGGNSPASRTLLDAGFTDAFRETFPDAERHPGPTHRSGRRIDQLYYKGAGLTHRSTKVVSTRPEGFPSDHFLIVSTFDLNYLTSRR